MKISEKDAKMQTRQLSRSGDSPLKFEGTLESSIDSRELAGEDSQRWYTVQVFGLADGRFVLYIHFSTKRAKENDVPLVWVGENMDAVKEILLDYEPLHARIGYPPGQNYEVLQVALEATLRVQWEWCIEQALADYPVEL